jgi:hypothetical protein
LITGSAPEFGTDVLIVRVDFSELAAVDKVPKHRPAHTSWWSKVTVPVPGRVIAEQNRQRRDQAGVVQAGGTQKVCSAPIEKRPCLVDRNVG